MTATESMELKLKTFKHSSAFTPGDPCSFSIKFNEEHSLPGKYDPVAYIGRLGADLAGKNVLVMCPGNGGLCTAAINAGASTVVALEPRDIYKRAVAAVAEFTSELTGTTFSQRALGEKLVETFDVVFWTEGVDEIPHPKNALESVLGAVAPGGVLYMELSLGHHDKLPESINSWRPSESAFKETIADYPEVQIVGELEGRDQARRIYTLKSNRTKVEVLPGPDYESVEDVREFADKLKDDLKENPKTFVSKDFVLKEVMKLDDQEIEEVKQADKQNEETAAQQLAERIKQLMPTDDAVDDGLDELYEERASTPKSKKKTAKKKAKKSRKKRSDDEGDKSKS